MGEHMQNSHHSQDNEHLLHSWASLSCFIMFLPIPHFIPRKPLTCFSVAGGYFAFICAVSYCRQFNFWFTFIYLSPLFYDPPILCYMPTFHYFAESIFCIICHNWSIHSSIDGHLDYVQVLQLTNAVAVNIHVQMHIYFHFSWVMSGNGMAIHVI